MAWGKVLGGVIGAAVGGPVGAGLGVLIGAGMDGQSSGPDQQESSDGKGGISAVQVGSSITVTVRVPANIDISHLVMRVTHDEQFVQSLVDYYRDPDGDFQLVYDVSGESTELDLPLDGLVLPVRGAVEIGVVAVAMKKADYVGHLATSLTVRPTPYAWSEIRWCSPAVDLLAYFALRDGAWTADKVRVIKEVFSDIIENDRDEFEALRDRLKLSSRPSVEECLQTYHRRFKGQPLVMGLLEGVAGLISLSGRPGDVVSAELHQLGRRLGATEPMIEIALTKSRQSGGKGSTVSSSEVHWARETLGVTDRATQDEIKLAWRKKVSELHPDRYADLPEVVQSLIKTKAQELNKARDILKL